MKTKLTTAIIALLALSLTGCDDNMTQEQIDAEIASDITEFNYKGHRYIMYHQRSGRSSVAGITHDPDCPCREKGDSDE